MKQKKVHLGVLAALCAVFLFNSCLKDRSAFQNDEAIQMDQVKEVIGEHINDFELVFFNHTSLWEEAKNHTSGNFNLDLRELGNDDWQFDTEETFLFSDDFELGLIGEGNVITMVEHPEMHFFDGMMSGTDTKIGFSISGDGYMTAEILDNDDNPIMIEPAFRYAHDAPVGYFVVYRPDQVNDKEAGSTCDHDDISKLEGKPSGNVNEASCKRNEVTYIGDFALYYSAFNYNWSNAVRWMADRMKYADRRYWNYNRFPLDITVKRAWLYTSNVKISYQVSNPPLFISEFRHFGNRNVSWFNRTDANILFTGYNVKYASGKNIAGKVLGIGYACQYSDDRTSYGFVEEFSNTYRENNVTAHELAHLFHGTHQATGFMCDDTGCQNHTMHANTTWELDWYTPVRYCWDTKTCN